MRPPVPLLPAGLPQLVGVDGELIDESGARLRTHRFHRRSEVDRRTGSVPLLEVRATTAHDDEIRLDARGALQADGLLTVTVALCLLHAPSRAADSDHGDVEAETTVVEVDGATAFALTFRDEHGCRVRAHGSIANLRERGC